MSDLYYDLDGRPITRDEWGELYRQKDEARRASPRGESTPENDPTRIGSEYVDESVDEGERVWVSTVWMGLDHNYFHPGDPPIIFETMVFGGSHDQWQDRYSTREQAAAGHARVVAARREGRAPGAAASS